MDVNIYYTEIYENISNWTLGENKPNSNPNKPNFRKAQMSANVFVTKDYENKRRRGLRKNKPNSNPISAKPKINANTFSQKDYKNETVFRPRKNKPNQTQFQTNVRQAIALETCLCVFIFNRLMSTLEVKLFCNIYQQNLTAINP